MTLTPDDAVEMYARDDSDVTYNDLEEDIQAEVFWDAFDETFDREEFIEDVAQGEIEAAQRLGHVPEGVHDQVVTKLDEWFSDNVSSEFEPVYERSRKYQRLESNLISEAEDRYADLREDADV